MGGLAKPIAFTYVSAWNYFFKPFQWLFSFKVVLVFFRSFVEEGIDARTQLTTYIFVAIKSLYIVQKVGWNVTMLPIWWPLIRKTEEQWDQIWFFRKVLISDFLTKVAQTLSNFWVYLENCHFWSKHCFGYFWELFWKIGLLFIAKSGRTYGGFPYDDVTACPIIDFLFFNTNFIEENCRLQWDSNSDRPNKRKVHWLGTRPPQCNIKIQCQL